MKTVLLCLFFLFFASLCFSQQLDYSVSGNFQISGQVAGAESLSEIWHTEFHKIKLSKNTYYSLNLARIELYGPYKDETYSIRDVKSLSLYQQEGPDFRMQEFNGEFLYEILESDTAVLRLKITFNIDGAFSNIAGERISKYDQSILEKYTLEKNDKQLMIRYNNAFTSVGMLDGYIDSKMIQKQTNSK